MPKLRIQFADGEQVVKIHYPGLLPIFERHLYEGRNACLKLAAQHERMKPAFYAIALTESLAALLEGTVSYAADVLAGSKFDLLEAMHSDEADSLKDLRGRLRALAVKDKEAQTFDLGDKLMGELRELDDRDVPKVPEQGTQISRELLVSVVKGLAEMIERVSGDFSRNPRYLETCYGPGGATTFLRRHPAIHRDLDVMVGQFIACLTELVERLAADWDVVSKTFFPTKPAASLVGIDAQPSDRHKSGRVVSILTFDQGQRVVYKPSDVEMDYWLIGDNAARGDQPSLVDLFNQLVAKRADKELLALPTYTILPRNPGSTLKTAQGALPLTSSYGWIYFIEKDPETQIAATVASDDFARQWGALQALAVLCSLSDLHLENILLRGGVPWPIDLENCCIGPMLAFSQTGLDGGPQIFGPKDRELTRKASVETLRTLAQAGPALLGWLARVEGCVARLVPMATGEFQDRLLQIHKLATQPARDAYLRNRAAITYSEWIKKASQRYDELWETLPVYALDSTEHNFADLNELNIPVYYHRLNEPDLYDARGRVVRVRVPWGSPDQHTSPFLPGDTLAVVRAQFERLIDTPERAIESYIANST